MAERIYFADDEKSIRELMEAFLKEEGYEVETFSSGEALLKACRESMPSLVVLDILMPGMDGLSACKALREMEPELPIILVSAKDSPYDRVKGFASGSDDYLVKPFLPLELVFRTHSLLRRKEEVAQDTGAGDDTFSFEGLRMIPGQRRAELDGRNLPLTPQRV